ncbi:armadillo-type protein [Gorgonomyces haynaldii]|nr:armadillo-type protein [Gorgonomyces haynaldii]
MEFLIGFVTVLVSFRAYDNVQRAIHLNKTRPKRDRPEDSLSLSHMEELMKSKSIVLRNAAHQILLERAQLEIPFILKQAQSKDPEKQKHALSVILELSQMDTNRTILVNHRCIKMLSKCLKTHLEPQQWRLIVMSLYHLIVDNDRRKLKFLGYSVLDRIVSFIESDEIFLSDLKHWCIILLHQLTLTDAAHHTLIQHDIINVFAEYCKRSFGNVQMQRICIHSIVRLLSSLEEEDPETVDQVFMKLRDLNMIPILANSLRKDDQELASWAIFFLHEFAHRDVLRDEIRQVKGLLKQLIPMMAQPNSIISRIILRILKCLCKDNMHFKMEIVRHNVFPKIIQSMDTSDSETQYWAISLLHELMTTPQMHQHFFHHDGLETLIAVAQANTHQAQLYISDIIALISANDIIDGNPNIPKLVNSGLVNLVLNFCKDEDEDLKYSGAALLLNLCNISDDLAKEAIELEATLVLSKFFDPSTRDATQVLASKSLLSLAQRGTLIDVRSVT